MGARGQFEFSCDLASIPYTLVRKTTNAQKPRESACGVVIEYREPFLFIYILVLCLDHERIEL